MNYRSTSVRYFIVKGESLEKISQKKWERFYSLREYVFPEYAGQILNFACVMVELKDRKPLSIVRIDRMKNKINELGGRDKDYEKEIGKYILNHVEPPKVNCANSVFDAADVFEKKRIEDKYRWKLTEHIEREIAAALCLVV